MLTTRVEPIVTRLKVATNTKTTHSNSPACGGWLGSLRRVPCQPAKLQEPLCQ